jgi:hypothetical protein
VTIVPVHLREANEIVKAIHRHHGPVVGYKFAIGAELDCLESGYHMRGVAICGRPVARHLDDGKTLEVLRLAVPWQMKNGCSALYGACARIAKEMGYKRIITYTLCTEPGTSLKASGWKQDGVVKGQKWSRPSRQRLDAAPVIDKIRWVRTLA